MKKLSILAAVLLVAGAAHAQQVTTAANSTRNPAFTPLTPFAPNPGYGSQLTPNAAVTGASAGAPLGSYTDYSQDSRVNQSGSHNEAYVDQADARTGGGGSSAGIDQTGDNNTAYQTQASAGNTTGGRNTMFATQAGSGSQSNQSQSGVDHSAAQVNQDAGSMGNAAVQNQSAGSNQSAYIRQTGTSSGNHADQTQTGGAVGANGGITAVTIQNGSNSFASQGQGGLGNDAGIFQGTGTANTAMQTQNGSYLNASIEQSGVAASNNYAKQTQTGFSNNASILQTSGANYAEQLQGDGSNVYQNNTSIINQSNVSSAAYTSQTGSLNTVIVNQH